jgi:signal transduction histidine kinase
LTPEEQAWLAAHPDIALGASTTYPPFVIKRDDGTYEGVLVDYLEAASRLLGQRIRLHIEDPWIKVQERAEKREIDGLALGGKSSDRAVLYLATDTLFDTYFSIFGLAKDEHPIRRFTDLDGKRIGHKVGAKPTIELLQKLPNAILIPYNDNEELSQALLSKEVEFVGDWITFDFFRKRTLQGMIDNIYLIDEYPMVMVSHIRKDWPEFVSIMNKVIAAMRQDELPRIMDKWFIDWPQQASTTSIQLTPEERAWLDQTPTVRVRIVDYPPYQMVEGNLPPQGITIEYLKLIGGRAGIEFKYEVTDQPFAEFLESMKQGKGPDMTALIARTPKREQYLSFTEPYLYSPYVIFIRQDDSPILDIQGLLGKTVAIPRGFVVQEQLESNYPGIKLTLVDSDEKALQAVATGQADAYIGSLTVASHIIHQKGLSHLKVTAAAPFANQTLSMGIRNDIPQLSSIIEKALASITAEERTTIRNKYLSIIFEQGIDKAEVLKWVLIFGGSALGILLTVLLWNRQMSREIRRRKQTELALKQAKSEAEAANQAKSSFLANVSHELRTPLNAILGFSRLLAREQNATPSQQEKLAIINRSGEHLLAMINDVLDLSKIEAGRIELEPEVFELPQLLGDVGRMFEVRAERHGLRFERSLDPGLARYVKADAGKLRQILINLLNNAVKFTAQGGIVLRARSAPVPGDPAMVGLQLEVEDSGCGMSPERQERIFEPFVQAEPTQSGTKGTGLGLAISKSFVALMGGQISVDSTLGEGSLFRVELPVASSLLREAGFEIREAENGAEAIDRFQQWQPHLIWMDMRMPVLDGYEAIPKIRKLAGGDAVKIVAITASAFKEQRPDILAAGCDEVVLKPFRAHEIFDTMARLLDIQYLYEEEGEEAPRKETIHLTAEMLAGLPEELLDELRESSQALNSEAALEVISRLAQQAPEVASALRKLVDHYQFDELQDLLGVSRNSHA